MILVTGATGNSGREVVRRLLEKNLAVRALTRNPAATEKIAGIEWVRGNFDDVESLQRAMAGVDRLVLISPAHAAMAKHQSNLIQAARSAGVKRIVKLSGLGAGPDAPIRLPRLHYEIEREIIASGIDHTFVRPNLFMQVLLGSAGSIGAEGVIYSPAGEGAISFIDVRDIADVIVCAVTNDSHRNSVYEVTGPAALTYAQAAETIGKVIGKPVHHVAVTPEMARESMLSSGMDKWLVEAFLELFDIYRAGHGATVLSSTVEQVTKHAASSLESFAQDYKSFFTQQQAA